MTNTFEQARTFFLRGLAHYQGARFTQAEKEFEAALALLPERVSTLTNLGATRMKLGKTRLALDLLDEALALEPHNLEALGHRATALAELGQYDQALCCIDSSLALNDRQGQAWSLRGSLLKDLGRRTEAVAAFENALAHGADDELNRYYLAAVEGSGAPGTAPLPYVQGLFDAYAGQFDQHLVQVLHYGAPRILVDALAQSQRRFASALDLGCGTGLCGPLVRPMAARLEGIDLSANMIARARALGVYDELSQADLVTHLRTTAYRHDLVLAADVFVYVGELTPVFQGALRVLDAGGLFCFSVEESQDGQPMALLPSLRYAHSEPYLRDLASQFGFEVTACRRHPIREHQGAPVPGLFAWLIKR